MLELKFLKIIKNSEDRMELFEMADEGDFADGKIKIVFKLLKEYYKKFFEFPSLDLFKEIIKERDDWGELYSIYEEVGSAKIHKGDYEYIKEEFFKKCKKRIFDVYLKKAEGLLICGNYDEAMDVFSRGIIEYNEKGNKSTDRGNLVNEGLIFLEKYNKIKYGKEKVIYTQLGWLNDLTGGCRPGHFWVLGGYKGEGKTTGLINFAYKNVVDGFNVLVISLEMNHDDFMKKVYSRHVVNYGNEITFDKINRGVLAVKEEESMRDALIDFKENKKYGNMNVVSMGSTNVLGIEAEIKRYRPEVVYIDYLQLLKPMIKMQSRTDMLADIIKDVRGLALKYNIFIMTAHQIHRKGYAKSRKVGHYIMTDLSESTEIEASATVLLSMFRNGAMRENNEVRIGVHKNRYGDIDDLGNIAYLDMERNFLADIEGGVEL